jgi:hypothetical protein
LPFVWTFGILPGFNLFINLLKKFSKVNEIEKIISLSQTIYLHSTVPSFKTSSIGPGGRFSFKTALIHSKTTNSSPGSLLAAIYRSKRKSFFLNSLFG